MSVLSPQWSWCSVAVFCMKIFAQPLSVYKFPCRFSPSPIFRTRRPTGHPRLPTPPEHPFCTVVPLLFFLWVSLLPMRRWPQQAFALGALFFFLCFCWRVVFSRSLVFSCSFQCWVLCFFFPLSWGFLLPFFSSLTVAAVLRCLPGLLTPGSFSYQTRIFLFRSPTWGGSYGLFSPFSTVFFSPLRGRPCSPSFPFFWRCSLPGFLIFCPGSFSSVCCGFLGVRGPSF